MEIEGHPREAIVDNSAVIDIRNWDAKPIVNSLIGAKV